MDLDTIIDEIEELPQFKGDVLKFSFGKIPYKINVNLNSPTYKTTNQRRPAEYGLTPDLNYDGKPTGSSLSVWIWYGVPKKFKKILLYHELKEAELELGYMIKKQKAHEIAVNYHMAYAKKFLSEIDFEKFLKWQSKCDTYKNSFFSI